jgi:uncharacterized Zn finger protein
MMDSELQILKTALTERWPRPAGGKAARYIDQFFERKRTGAKIVARVVGNHGTYTVSIEAGDAQTLVSACSCYIGKHGGCHHCAALAATFLNNPDSFAVSERVALADVRDFSDLPHYLQGVTLDELTDRLREAGITQKAFAESIGMSPAHLTAVKSSERRNRQFHELGAIKLACLWVLEHLADQTEGE